jgi:hypothetical protein
LNQLPIIFRNLRTIFIAICAGFPPAWYYITYFVIAVLVQTVYPPLVCFLVLDIVVVSPTTKTILMAVYKPAWSILVTVIFIFCIVYCYAVAYYFSFRLQFKDNPSYLNSCNTLKKCFLTVLNNGQRLTGGAGNQMRYSIDSNRVAVDMTSYWVIMIVFINLPFGIIIDTFASVCMLQGF